MEQPQNGSKAYLISIVMVAVLGGLLFGYDTAVISGAEKGLQAFFKDAGDFDYHDGWHGFTSASALIGSSSVRRSVACWPPIWVVRSRSSLPACCSLSLRWAAWSPSSSSSSMVRLLTRCCSCSMSIVSLAASVWVWLLPSVPCISARWLLVI